MSLTCKYQHSQHCKDGKRRNYLFIFFDDVLILKQKIPYDETIEAGYDNTTRIYNIYLLNGKIYQTRKKWLCEERNVSFPVSKKVLNQLNIDNTIKYETK